MMTKIPTAGMSREAWLAERRKSLGGSDIGAVLGLNRYRSPYSVWAEKVGLLPEESDNEAMRQGRDLEGYVAERFQELSGKTVQRMNYILRNDAAPYLHANIDRRVVGEASGLECKTASALNMKAYAGGEFPESYYAQCVAYLAVTEWDRWYLAALILNKAFCVYQITTVQDDPCPSWCQSSVYVAPAELSALKRCAADFWEQHVLTEEPPPLDGAESTTDALETIYAGQEGGDVELFGRESLLTDFFCLSSERKDIERRMDAIKQTLMQDMGGAVSARCPGYSISWRPQERRTFDAARFHRDHPGFDLAGYYKTTAMRPMKIKKETV